ncbi:DNA repair exonuclease SbcCD ATPase subunit [Catalinimonas alkaloidigena]|uniref:Ezrin/radixin/moesin family protein n=1 Tax=Catalinimonas alkaloidigena TaxID=1075417 RepID=UPI00240593F9|nr:Ezrin/radixin/moesin family protein [Catalinimonas alkaloidigena]MDF9801046.1 DNA repair exonuclease SbcCD ATPase subunit [Catalinimonas alkaloidigena]
MKYLWIVALLFFTMTVVPEVTQAQELSRKEKKRLKKEQKRKLKELKKMSPADFEALREKQDEFKQQASELQSEVTSLQKQSESKDSEIKQLKDQVRKLESQLQEARAELETEPGVEQNVPLSNQYDEGLVFRVQIGAYRDKNLEAYLDTSENFNGETDAEGLQIYTLGNFRDYWEANKFKKYLRAMGVKDAWIVPYRDGIRVPIKEVLEDLRSNQNSE